MRGNAENVQRSVQRNLDGLSIGKPGPKATPVHSKVETGINTIIRADIERVRCGRAVDLDRPYRQIGKGAGAHAADAGPGCPAVEGDENMPVSVEGIHHRVGDLGVGGIDLDVIDSAVACREVVLRPGRPVSRSNKDLA